MAISGAKALSPLQTENGPWSMPVVLSLSEETPALTAKSFTSTKLRQKALQAIQSSLRKSTNPTFPRPTYFSPLKTTETRATTMPMASIRRSLPVSETALGGVGWADSGYVTAIGQSQLHMNAFVCSGQSTMAELCNGYQIRDNGVVNERLAYGIG